MTKEEKNHQAYLDVLDCEPPSQPNDAEYMECYTFWRPLQKFPYEDYFED